MRETKRILLFLSLFIPLFFFSSCKDEEPVDKNQENIDFYNFMNDWYYWYKDIPVIDPSLYPSPYEVLEVIRHRPLDRWSYVSSWQEFYAYYVESSFIGYGFGSSWDAGGRLRVSFIFESSQLYADGVRRTWIIDAINGTDVRQGMNINEMLGPAVVGITNTFRFIKPDGTSQNISAAKQEVVMNSVLHDTVMLRDTRKIAYLALQGFTGPTRDELDLAFERFASENVDELILDLRYNGGGLTDVANYLSGMIGGSKVADKVFVSYEYNDRKAQQHNKIMLFADDLKQQLEIDRLMVISSRSTASASELVINGLKPYMPVWIVGDRTYGKPMGMNAFEYPSGNPKYAFVPITFTTKNADNQGDYFDGIPADIPSYDDLEKALGDPEEASLKAALYFIETGSLAKSEAVQSVDLVQPRDQMRGLQFIIGTH